VRDEALLEHMARSSAPADVQPARHRGRVARYHAGRGYGFIHPDDGGADIFFHFSDCGGVDFFGIGARVEYSIGVARGCGRPKAILVCVIA
jgi:cold shock CspA family protein